MCVMRATHQWLSESEKLQVSERTEQEKASGPANADRPALINIGPSVPFFQLSCSPSRPTSERASPALPPRLVPLHNTVNFENSIEKYVRAICPVPVWLGLSRRFTPLPSRLSRL